MGTAMTLDDVLGALGRITVEAVLSDEALDLIGRLITQVENDNVPSRLCNCGSGLPSRELLDARGIYCGRVCDRCEQRIKSSFRPAIFSDPNYYTDEPIEEDGTL